MWGTDPSKSHIKTRKELKQDLKEYDNEIEKILKNIDENIEFIQRSCSGDKPILPLKIDLIQRIKKLILTFGNLHTSYPPNQTYTEVNGRLIKLLEALERNAFLTTKDFIAQIAYLIPYIKRAKEELKMDETFFEGIEKRMIN